MDQGDRITKPPGFVPGVGGPGTGPRERIIMNICYTGTPGSGKSLRAMQEIEKYLNQGKNVIANFPIKINKIKKAKGHYYYLPNEHINVQYLVQFSKQLHELEKENQTLIVFDEASVKFNARDFSSKDRMEFLNFFSQHRKYGYNILMITQSLRQIDRQVRDQFELEVKHRKLNSYKIFWMLPFPLFISIKMHIAFKDKIEHEFFFYKKKYGEMYDTFYEFDQRIVADEKKAEEYKEIIESTEIQKHNDEIKGNIFSRLIYRFVQMIEADIEETEDDKNEVNIFTEISEISNKEDDIDFFADHAEIYCQTDVKESVISRRKNAFS